MSKQKFDQAIEPFLKITEIDPANDAANYSLGRIFLKKNDLGRSIQFLERSFSQSPSIEYARSLGDAYFQAGRFGQAADRFKFILNRRDDDEYALSKFAACAFQEGEKWAAAKLYAKLIDHAPQNLDYKSRFIRSLIGVPRSMDGVMQRAYADCLKEGRISCSPAIDAWFMTMNEEPRFKTVLERIAEAKDDRIGAVIYSDETVAVLNNEFVYLGFEKLLYPSDLIEHALRNIRKAILRRPSLADPIIRFVQSAATQIYLTDYALVEGLDESRQVEELLSDFQCKELSDSDTTSLLILACYRPLHAVTQLREQPDLFADNDELRELTRLQVSDAQIEFDLKSTITSFGESSNAVSEATRAQYEENPCPRWTGTEVIPQPKSMLERTKGLEILNAGCGTGLEAANAAQTLKTSRVTAIDLSLSSLAYGKRKAAEAGIDNLDFLRGDILAIGQLDKSFDLILSSGVLHHMEDPQLGLNSLANVLKPTGSRMLVGLYSKIAREHLFGDIWQHISDRGYQANASDIRQFRDDVLASDVDSPLRNALKFRDFTTLSECRDLFFHVQEHRLTCLDIREMIDRAGLKLVEFVVHPDERRRYRAMFPDNPAATNLTYWHRYETQFPETFRNMYYLWLAHEGDQETEETSPAIWATRFI